jgi:molybdopterin synthase catalytic subunit
MHPDTLAEAGTLTVRIQQKPFDASTELALLSANHAVGAITSFVGTVRSYGDCKDVVALQLEHYPGMTEQSLRAIARQASRRWPIAAATVVHRVGYLPLGEPIVLVAIAAAHRRDAFAACEFVMDWLKTEAPFWKREITADGQAHWVAAKASDAQAGARWHADDAQHAWPSLAGADS